MCIRDSVIADAQGNIIKLEHNQFVSINRNSAVELTITMEAVSYTHLDVYKRQPECYAKKTAKDFVRCAERI